MEGFISVRATKRQWPEFGVAHNVATYFDKFFVDEKLDVYVKRGMGAVVGNVDILITDVEQLRGFVDKKTKINPYQKYLNMLDQGYELIVGKPFVDQNGGVSKIHSGIYCKNYLEIAIREEEKGQIVI